MKSLSTILSLLLLCSCAWSQSPEPSPTADQASALAQPGKLMWPHAGYFGFASAVYLNEQGIWGALLITEEQAEALNLAFNETWRKRIEGGVNDSAEAKMLEREFDQRRAEILTPEQAETIRMINETFALTVATEANDGGKKDDLLIEALRPLLGADRMQNLESTRGQKP